VNEPGLAKLAERGSPIHLMGIGGAGMAGLALLIRARGGSVSGCDNDVNATTPIAVGDRVFITSGYGTGCMLLKVGRSGAEVLWKNEVIAAQHSDPYAIDGFLYGYSGDSSQNRGTFKCVSLADGSENWATDEMGWGTCMWVDGHLLCCDIKGNLFLISGRQYRF